MCRGRGRREKEENREGRSWSSREQEAFYPCWGKAACLEAQVCWGHGSFPHLGDSWEASSTGLMLLSIGKLSELVVWGFIFSLKVLVGKVTFIADSDWGCLFSAGLSSWSWGEIQEGYGVKCSTGQWENQFHVPSGHPEGCALRARGAAGRIQEAIWREK